MDVRRPDPDYWSAITRLARDASWVVVSDPTGSGLTCYVSPPLIPQRRWERLWLLVRPYVYGDLVMVAYTTERVYTYKFPDGYDRVIPGPVKRIRRPLRRLIWPE